jgi:hypothetical protein
VIAVIVVLLLVALAVCIFMAIAPVSDRRQDRMTQRWLEAKWLADARREPFDQDGELGR